MSPEMMDRENGLTEANGASPRSEKRWWEEVLDKKEAKNQVLFSLPIILTTVFYYLITLISVMFAGHLGELELAGATLANSWAIVTGFGLMTGSSGALETLCGQSFGAAEFRMLGIYLQGSCIISLFFSIIVSVIWIYTEPILILLHQDRYIAMKAALYMKYLIPGLFAYGILQNILRFLQTQSVVVPLAVLSSIALCMHVGIAYCLIHLTPLEFQGAPIAASISLWISVLMLSLYVLCGKKFKKTWNGVSLESFRYILPNLKLALPSAAMVCLEYWAFEVLVFLAGLMPNPNISTSLIAICVNTEAVAFMLIYGLSAAASTRVSNELGAGNVHRAKKAMVVTLKLSVLLDLAMVLALVFGHNIWADFFSDSHAIRKEFSSMRLFLAASIIFDSVQGILSGVARGCGWQNLAAFANLGGFYFIGMPVAGVLGFKVKLHVKGLWIGLICGLICQSAALFLIAIRRKWRRTDVSESKDENQREAESKEVESPTVV